jgi:anti-sigma B factor antagonist
MFQRTHQGAVAVLAGAAPLNQETADQMRTLLRGCLAGGQPMAVLDLEKVSLIDSAGLEVLVDAQEEFLWRGGTIKLAAPNPLCRDILHVSGLDKRFEVYPETRSAVGSFLK